MNDAPVARTLAPVRKPVIGIVPSLIPEKSSCTVRDHYTNAIVAAGGVPVILPLTVDTTVYETLFPFLDGFLLTGGQDIDPARYGDVDLNGKTDEHTPTREEVECLVLSYAYRFDVPVLGICRGMQVINVFFGGTLYLDLADAFAEIHDGAAPSVAHWQHEDYGTPTHFVSIVRASKLGRILDADTLATNSMHHQGVRDLGPVLDAAAYGPDGLVEAVEVRDRSFIMGVQWHPEFFAGDKGMGCLFSSLVHEAECAARRRSAGDGRTSLIPGPIAIKRVDTGDPWPEITFADYI